jgi:methylmalonyl-CoA mutase
MIALDDESAGAARDDGPARLDPTGSAADIEAWRTAAAAVLRKAGRSVADSDPVENVLSKHTLEDLTVPALGTPQLLTGLPATGEPGAAPFTRGAALRNQGWGIRSEILAADPKSANAVALQELMGGATSLWLPLTGGWTVGELQTVLHDVRLDLAPVIFSGLESEPHALAGELRRLGESGPLHPRCNLGADPVGAAVRAGAPGSPDLRILPEIASAARDLDILGITVDATAAHDGGAGDVTELGYALAVGATYLRVLQESGLDPADAADLIEFRFAATDEQFLTIAKFRAARLVWDRVLEISGIERRGGQRQHAVTSWPMTTRWDPWTNLLRTTIATFAAGVGGADAITVRPYDAAVGLPGAEGRRWARNISHLLLGESHVAATTDPAGGAPAVEALTWELAEAAWAEFERIEGGGGVLAALADGSLRSCWRAVAATRDKQIASRRRPITGVSEFPQATEPAPAGSADSADRGVRWSQPYEELRDAPAPATLPVLTFGSAAAHTARLTFAGNALAAGGIPTDVVDVAAFADAVPAGTRAVLLAGADPDYAAQGPELIERLRAAGVRHVILAGRPSPELAPLVDDHLAMGEDLLAFLRRTRADLTTETATAGGRP